MTLKTLRSSIFWLMLVFMGFYFLVNLTNFLYLEEYSDHISFIAIVTSIPTLFFCYYKRKNKERIPWAIFLFSAVTYGIGDALWFYYDHICGIEIETPSLCDLFYILNTFTCFIAFVLFIYYKKEKIDLARFSVDLFITMFACVGVIYIFVISPIINSDSFNFLAVTIKSFYAIGDMALIFAFLLLLFASSVETLFRPSNILFLTVFIMMSFADLSSLIGDLYDVDLSAYIDPIWSCCYLTIGIAGLYDFDDKRVYARKISSINQNNIRNDILTNIRILLPYTITFTLLFYLAFKYELFNAVFLWSMAIMALLSCRQFFIIIRNRMLLKKISENEHQLNVQNIKLQKLNEQILHDSQIDFLTQLANRRYIDECLEKLKQDIDECCTLGVLLIDVDYFKRINDTYGHQVGDTVLQCVAEKIRSALRSNDIAGRFGGDEFIVLLPAAQTTDVAEVAETIESLVNSDQQLATWKVHLSMGGVSMPLSKSDFPIDQVLKRADAALYEAKLNGRNQWCLWSPNMGQALA